MNACIDNIKIELFFAGRLFEVDAEELNLDCGSSDRELRDALAAHLRIKPSRLHGHAINRHPQGDITVRPALFG
jgi:hypothetical protein